MAEKQVVEFIKTERAKGIPDDTIRIMLTANGWEVHEIAEAYLSLDSNAHIKKTSVGDKIFYTILIIIGIAVIVWLLVY